MATAPSKSVLMKRIAGLKEENEKLQEIVNFMRQENFEYSFECNRMENIIEKIQTICQSNPQKLIESTSNLSSILQMCTTLQVEKSSNKKTPKAVADTSSKSNKAHVVKPHMVNGTVLYIPTINLTRVSDVNSSSTTRRSSQHERQNKNSQEDNPGCVSSTSDGNESGSSSSTPDSQSSDLDDDSGPSTSTSLPHSAVLSGSFQEVTIYVNPVSQDSLGGETNRSVTVRSSPAAPKVAKRRKH